MQQDTSDRHRAEMEQIRRLERALWIVMVTGFITVHAAIQIFGV